MSNSRPGVIASRIDPNSEPVSSPSRMVDRGTAPQPDDPATVDARLLGALFDGIHGRWNKRQMYAIHGELAERLARYRGESVQPAVAP